MSGDIKAINSWARSTAMQARAIAQNTGVSASDAKEKLIRDNIAARNRNTKQRTGK